MVDKVRESLKRIDHRLFIALLFMGLCPTVYTTLRTFFLGTLPGEWSYSIAGQLSWINLIYEVINEAIILPLYFFMGSALTDKKAFANRIRSGLLVSFGVYAVCSVLVATFINPLLQFMAVSTDIIEESAAYIRIECVANVFGILYSFLLVALVSIGKDKLVYIMTGAKLVMCIILDTMMVSNLPVSMKLGVNGIGISNCISNLLLFVIAFALIQSCGYPLWSKERLSFDWMKEFFKIGGISGLESFVRNVAYMHIKIFLMPHSMDGVKQSICYWNQWLLIASIMVCSSYYS